MMVTILYLQILQVNNYPMLVLFYYSYGKIKIWKRTATDDDI